MTDAAMIRKYLFIAVLILVAYLTYIMLWPFFEYIVVGLVLVIVFRPLYRLIKRFVRNDSVSSILTIIVVVLLVVIPCILIARALASDVSNLIAGINRESLGQLEDYIQTATGQQVDLVGSLRLLAGTLQNQIISSGIGFVGSLTDFLVGLFIVLMITYYGLCYGDQWMAQLDRFLPFDPGQKKRLEAEMKNVIKFVGYGQIFISLIQGFLGALAFYIVGIDNPIFWGVVMAVLALLPFVGSILVWLPAGLLLLVQGNNFGGIFLIIYGLVLINGIEYFLRPLLVPSKSTTHPLVLVLGLFGGLKAFGFLGIIIGPLIASVFFTLAIFYYQDNVREHMDKSTQKGK